LAQVLRVAAPQHRRVVILDCCFSEAAAEGFSAMGALDEAVATTAISDLEPQIPPPDRGTLLLCSSPRRRVSIGKPSAERTLFTGTLLDVLTTGSHRSSPMLSFADLRDDIYDRMLREYCDGAPPRPALHQPDQQAGDLTRLPAFPNLAAIATSQERLLSNVRAPEQRTVTSDPAPKAPATPQSSGSERLRSLITVLRSKPSITLKASSIVVLAAILALFLALALPRHRDTGPDTPPSATVAPPAAEPNYRPAHDTVVPPPVSSTTSGNGALINKSTCLVNCP
jgi:hypothetical protein